MFVNSIVNFFVRTVLIFIFAPVFGGFFNRTFMELKENNNFR